MRSVSAVRLTIQYKGNKGRKGGWEGGHSVHSLVNSLRRRLVGYAQEWLDHRHRSARRNLNTMLRSFSEVYIVVSICCTVLIGDMRSR